MKEFDKLEMIVENVKPSEATLKFIHPNADVLTAYRTTGWTLLFKEINGEWKKIKPINQKKEKGLKDFEVIRFIIQDDSQAIFEENWEELYGQLSSGKYGILKQVLDSRVIIGVLDYTIMCEEFIVN